MQPTAYPVLNEVLAELVAGVQRALANNFVGAYLQGSFAVGDFSEFSDCDFIVVTRRDLTSAELERVQQLHQRIYHLPAAYWPTNLEGSYAPAAILRRWSTEPRDPPGEPRAVGWGDPGMSGSPAVAYPFWYLNHGANYLVRSEHDNSQVVRWCLREKGVVLAGPAPAELIDEVPGAALREEVYMTMHKALATGLEMPSVVLQAFWVGLFCRILHTHVTATITSKKAAMSWACETLHDQWTGLIERALSQRKGDRAQATQTSDPAEVAATRAFATYCVAWVDSRFR